MKVRNLICKLLKDVIRWSWHSGCSLWPLINWSAVRSSTFGNGKRFLTTPLPLSGALDGISHAYRRWIVKNKKLIKNAWQKIELSFDLFIGRRSPKVSCACRKGRPLFLFLFSLLWSQAKVDVELFFFVLKIALQLFIVIIIWQILLNASIYTFQRCEI